MIARGREIDMGATDVARSAWVELLDEEIARPLFEAHPYNFGFVPAMGRLLAAHERIGPFFAGLFGQIMFEPGALSRREREMIAAVAAAAQDCHY
jgi:alkylhydroperoxidase/carboxymuconolactone decarboxylase family protein YurZ